MIIISITQVIKYLNTSIIHSVQHKSIPCMAVVLVIFFLKLLNDTCIPVGLADDSEKS